MLTLSKISGLPESCEMEDVVLCCQESAELAQEAGILSLV